MDDTQAEGQEITSAVTDTPCPQCGQVEWTLVTTYTVHLTRHMAMPLKEEFRCASCGKKALMDDAQTFRLTDEYLAGKETIAEEAAKIPKTVNVGALAAQRKARMSGGGSKPKVVADIDESHPIPSTRD